MTVYVPMWCRRCESRIRPLSGIRFSCPQCGEHYGEFQIGFIYSERDKFRHRLPLIGFLIRDWQYIEPWYLMSLGVVYVGGTIYWLAREPGSLVNAYR